MLGRIKFLDRENRGFGFIIADDGTEFFYHIKDVLNGQPIKGQKCEFVAEQEIVDQSRGRSGSIDRW